MLGTHADTVRSGGSAQIIVIDFGKPHASACVRSVWFSWQQRRRNTQQRTPRELAGVELNVTGIVPAASPKLKFSEQQFS
jgi:hypothetical protein